MFFPAMSPRRLPGSRRLNVPVIHAPQLPFRLLERIAVQRGQECRECLKGSFLPGVQKPLLAGKADSQPVFRLLSDGGQEIGHSAQCRPFYRPFRQACGTLKTTGIPEEKTSILPLFVETHLLPYVPAPEGGTSLFVGRLTPEKGLMPVLQGMGTP